jgi:hypothetical protein
MILNKVDLLWDNEPENLQIINHLFFMVEDMALRQVSLRLLFRLPLPSRFQNHSTSAPGSFIHLSN